MSLGVWNPSTEKGFHDYILALSGLKLILLTWGTTWKVFSSWFYRRVEGRSPKSARWKIFARAVSEKCYFLFFIFALIVIMLFVQTMHSLCLWPLVSTTESFFFFFYSPSYIGLFCFLFFFFFFKSSKYVTWTISVKIYQYACRSSALLLLFFFHCDAVRPNLTLTFFFSLSLSIRKGQTHFCKFPETSSDAAIVFFLFLFCRFPFCLSLFFIFIFFCRSLFVKPV